MRDASNAWCILMNDVTDKQPLHGKKPANGNRSDFAADEQWRQVLRVAWRPAWQIRSRKGCLAPFIRWWKARRHCG
jgi:hypothetical protein